MVKTFYREYVLLVDLPTGEKKGDHFFFHVDNSDYTKVWYELGSKSEYSGNWHSGIGNGKCKLEIDQMLPKFFKPVGKPEAFYPPFPSEEKFGEFYFLLGESRFTRSVDEIRAIEPIFESEEYWKGCYDLLKKMYNEKYFGNEKGT